MDKWKMEGGTREFSNTRCKMELRRAPVSNGCGHWAMTTATAMAMAMTVPMATVLLPKCLPYFRAGDALGDTVVLFLSAPSGPYHDSIGGIRHLLGPAHLRGAVMGDLRGAVSTGFMCTLLCRHQSASDLMGALSHRN